MLRVFFFFYPSLDPQGITFRGTLERLENTNVNTAFTSLHHLSTVQAAYMCGWVTCIMRASAEAAVMHNKLKLEFDWICCVLLPLITLLL